MTTERYYLKADHQTEWDEVTREQFIAAEQAAGFRSKFGDSHPATSGFTGRGMQGRVECVEQPNTAPPASGAGERYNFVVFTGRYKILDYHKPDGQQIATADNEEAARTIVRALNTAEQHSTLIEQREQLIRAMWGLLVEAEVSNVLWQQSRGFVGTVDDAYRKGLMPAAYSRAKQVLTTIEQEGETRG